MNIWLDRAINTKHALMHAHPKRILPFLWAYGSFVRVRVCSPVTLTGTRPTFIRLAEVIGRITDAVVIVENRSAVGIQSLDFEITVGVVVAVRLVIPGISQPPSAAVCSPPSALLRGGAPHGVPRAAAAPVRGTSHVNNQVGPLRVIFEVPSQSVVHAGPVVFVARRPDLPT